MSRVLARLVLAGGLLYAAVCLDSRMALLLLLLLTLALGQRPR